MNRGRVDFKAEKENSDRPILEEASLKRKLPVEIAEALNSQLASSPVAKVRTLGLISNPVIVNINAKNMNSVALRRLYGAAIQAVSGFEEVNVNFPKNYTKEQVKLSLLGAAQGSYRFDKYKTKKRSLLTQINLNCSSASQKTAIQEAKIIAQAIEYTRDWINTTAEDMGPKEFVDVVKKASKGSGLKIRLLDKVQCEKLGCGGLLAVGRASPREPRMLILDWRGSGKSKGFQALVGKGVCFDTGGLGIKPSANMVLMKKDMGGAATVAAAMIAIAELKGKNRIRAYIPLAENSISGNAFRPGDVLTMANGATVEVGHTDAEGRLLLADAISIAVDEGAKKIVTVATLTGAAAVALGRIHVPVMGDNKIIASLLAGAEKSGEKIWQLPMDEDHLKMVRGKVADLTNADASGEAGCITAGAFLWSFADKVPFAHCDISPGSWAVRPNELGPVGATGVLVSTLIESMR